jgi:hypothetical protein
MKYKMPSKFTSNLYQFTLVAEHAAVHLVIDSVQLSQKTIDVHISQIFLRGVL